MPPVAALYEAKRSLASPAGAAGWRKAIGGMEECHRWDGGTPSAAPPRHAGAASALSGGFSPPDVFHRGMGDAGGLRYPTSPLALSSRRLPGARMEMRVARCSFLTVFVSLVLFPRPDLGWFGGDHPCVSPHPRYGQIFWGRCSATLWVYQLNNCCAENPSVPQCLGARGGRRPTPR